MRAFYLHAEEIRRWGEGGRSMNLFPYKVLGLQGNLCVIWGRAGIGLWQSLMCRFLNHPGLSWPLSLMARETHVSFHITWGS